MDQQDTGEDLAYNARLLKLFSKIAQAVNRKQKYGNREDEVTKSITEKFSPLTPKSGYQRRLLVAEESVGCSEQRPTAVIQACRSS